MASATATAVGLLVVVIFGCLLMRVLATNRTEPRVTVNSSDDGGQNVTEVLADCPPRRQQHAGLRYIVAQFNFSHVQTPFIVAAWILFVTLAKIGNKSYYSYRFVEWLTLFILTIIVCNMFTALKSC